MERRINFAIGDTHARAHAMDEFVKLVETMSCNLGSQGFALSVTKLQVGKIPKWFEYDRGSDLELWMLCLQ